MPPTIPASLIAIGSLLASPVAAQWQMLPLPMGVGRYDDIHFADPLHGWVVNGSGTIHHTTDGGDSWQLQASQVGYLRSVLAIDPLKAFAGTLNGKLMRTLDGGAEWVNIAPLLPQPIPGICGLTAPDPLTIVGCGIWNSPAFIIRSEDGGSTWSHANMSAHASALVDIWFTDPMTGLACGRTPEADGGGVIIGTTDGGQTWTERHRTNQTGEYIWKLHTIDGQRWYASIVGNPALGNTRYAWSDDGGLTWSEGIVADFYSYIQLIGALTNDHVYTGGGSLLFESLDGGASWGATVLGTEHNRFLWINDSTAFISGNQVFRRGTPVNTSVPAAIEPPMHELRVRPNPTGGMLQVEARLIRDTWLKVHVLGADGRIVHRFFDGSATAGEHRWNTDLGHLAAQLLHVVLDSNEGQRHVKVVLTR
ncbi:MAG: hypothetical protein KIT10_12520 [Flavobacteriales bacterium]|nr:hypothetical protein [Flavobacteriales bacterium]